MPPRHFVRNVLGDRTLAFIISSNMDFTSNAVDSSGRSRWIRTTDLHHQGWRSNKYLSYRAIFSLSFPSTSTYYHTWRDLSRGLGNFFFPRVRGCERPIVRGLQTFPGRPSPRRPAVRIRFRERCRKLLRSLRVSTRPSKILCLRVHLVKIPSIHN